MDKLHMANKFVQFLPSLYKLLLLPTQHRPIWNMSKMYKLGTVHTEHRYIHKKTYRHLDIHRLITIIELLLCWTECFSSNKKQPDW